MKHLVVLFVLTLQDPPKTMTLVPPIDAKAADVERASKALEKRITDFGYKGVSVTPNGLEVVISCQTGITHAMHSRISELAGRPSAKIEFMLLYQLSDREKEQYIEGKTAPNGASWLRLNDGTYKLIVDSTRTILNGRITWKQKADKETFGELSSGEPFFEFQADMARLMKEQSEKLKRVPILMLIDGRQVRSVGTIHWKLDEKTKAITGCLWRCEEAKDEFTGICLNNPLPFALEVKK